MGAAVSLPRPVGCFGDYELLEEIGRGGMGVVYKARQVQLNRIVALKMILAGAHAGSVELERFLAEAKAVAALQHPGIVQVYDFGQHDGLPYMALEYVNGGSLAARLRQGLPLPKEAASLVEQLARGVAAAHDKGIVHRDLKPQNVLLRGKSEIRNSKSENAEPKPDHEDSNPVSGFGLRISDLEPKVTDFGLAQTRRGRQRPDADGRRGGNTELHGAGTGPGPEGPGRGGGRLRVGRDPV